MDPLRGDILVVGLGSSGEAVATYGAARAAQGDPVRITVVDSGDSALLQERADRLRALGVEVRLACAEVFGSYDLAVASPGIPPHVALMRSARAAAAEVISEIEFAYRRSVAPWLAVTGTNGKTTVTSLLGHVLRCAGVSAQTVGNIGLPAVLAVSEVGAAGALVAEVSSFQLALTDRFHPRVSVLLNITPDHLDWHGDLDTYALDKTRIFARQDADDTAVINADDAGSARFVDVVRDQGVRVVEVSVQRVPDKGAGLSPTGMLVIETSSGPVELLHRDELRIRGEHNVGNALAAAAAACAFGVRPDSISSGLRTFAPIEHRLEPVGTVRGVEYFNDSKATNPDAAAKALTAFAGRPVVVLLGGRNKGNRFIELGEAIAEAGAAAVLFGEAAAVIAADLTDAGATFVRATGLADAVRRATETAIPGTAVVLSPACASFDEFSDYAERGRVFRALVHELERGSASREE